ncbi:MAG: 4-hydroxy-tetrahydrodipicolinate reductase [Nitrospinae bacterium]|nr:4-hydroxy-tetrahydrodipicolinate reductase [Nitrospinota bacterium]
MLKVAVTGCAGRMGQEISRLVLDHPGMELAGGTVHAQHPLLGSPLLSLLGKGNAGPKIAASLKDIIGAIDVVIDFTAPSASLEHFNIVADAGKAIVVGTTGFSPEQKKQMESRANAVKCVTAPNMSVGVNVMFNLLAQAAKTLKGYDIEIMEIHHNLKKDAPSGTAMRLAEICARETGRDLAKTGVYGREGIVGERKPDEIAVMSLRMGDVVGEHTVYFGGNGERVEITHKATSRKNFAAGAVRAAEWLPHQKNGFYDMQDVLGLK